MAKAWFEVSCSGCGRFLYAGDYPGEGRAERVREHCDGKGFTAVWREREGDGSSPGVA